MYEEAPGLSVLGVRAAWGAGGWISIKPTKLGNALARWAPRLLQKAWAAPMLYLKSSGSMSTALAFKVMSQWLSWSLSKFFRRDWGLIPWARNPERGPRFAKFMWSSPSLRLVGVSWDGCDGG